MVAAAPLILLLASVGTLAACSPGQPVSQGVQQSVPPETASRGMGSGIVPPTMDGPQTTVAATATDLASDEAGIYARLSRLENDVASMKGQISQIAPALEKMPDLQVKLSELVTELRNLDARVGAASAHAQDLPVPANKPMALAPVEPTVKPAPAKGLMTPTVSSSEQVAVPKPQEKAEVKKTKAIPMKSADAPKAETHKDETKAAAAIDDNATRIQQVRVGDYPDKTRIVLDISKRANFTYDLDNTEKLLIVEVDAVAWNAAAGADFAKSPIVASYTAQATDNGKYRLILQLRQPVKLLRAQALPPNADKGDRIVLDLAKVQA